MYRYVLLFLTALLLSRCANIVPPVGGPKDETPPQVIWEKSTPNQQTNFQKQRIELTFDEWIVLEDVFNQVVVSPPLQYRPKLSLKGKTLRIDFDTRDTLRENATYTINFGNAVKDLTEKNPANNLRFVFSTGPFLDSLKVSGKLVDAQTGKPVDGALFMLYDNVADSVVRTQRPFYFAKTDTSGRFMIENVREGTFKGFALKDANLNYKFDQANELIGFPDSLLHVQDSLTNVQVSMFTENRLPRLLDSDAGLYGLIKLVFNQPPPRNLDFDADNVGQRTFVEYNADTAYVWYNLDKPVEWHLYVGQDTLWRDTVTVPPTEKGAALLGIQLAQVERRNGGTTTRLNPDKTVEVKFTLPIISYDTSKITLYEDTLRRVIQSTILVDTLSPRSLFFKYPWKEEQVYLLQLLPGAVQDLYGLVNNDTILLNYRVEPRKNFANLQLTIDSLDAAQNYVVQLLQGTTVVKEFKVSGTSSVQQQFNTLPPGEYTVQIITDWNNNGRWDTGSYDEKRQPEPIMQRKLDNLRANWDANLTVRL